MFWLHAKASLYLAGEPTTELLATKWLLEQRGYGVQTWADLPKHFANSQPDERAMRQLRTVAMMNATAVVITEAATTEEVLQLREICRFMGKRLLLLDEVPLLATDVNRTLLEQLDLCALAPSPSLRQRMLATYTRANAWWQRLERVFNARFGWFFTNGNKVQEQPAPVAYPTPKSESNVTA